MQKIYVVPVAELKIDHHNGNSNRAMRRLFPRTHELVENKSKFQYGHHLLPFLNAFSVMLHC